MAAILSAVVSWGPRTRGVHNATQQLGADTLVVVRTDRFTPLQQQSRVSLRRSQSLLLSRRERDLLGVEPAYILKNRQFLLMCHTRLVQPFINAVLGNGLLFLRHRRG